jgi:hypothetical protein
MNHKLEKCPVGITASEVKEKCGMEPLCNDCPFSGRL